jgi:hypothetical protein
VQDPLEPPLDLDEHALVIRRLPEPLVHDEEAVRAVAVGGRLDVEVREVVPLQELGKLRGTFECPFLMAVDVQHQQGV